MRLGRLPLSLCWSVRSRVRNAGMRLSGALRLCACLLIVLSAGCAWAQQRGSLQGRVLDPSGAVIPGATIQLLSQQGGKPLNVTTDAAGHYSVSGLAPGSYRMTVKASGFRRAVQVALVESKREKTVDIHLEIAIQSQSVVVQGSAPQLDVSPASNASAISVSGRNLDALANDPDELQMQLQALAGPAVGAAGSEIYINGFTGGDMPPKSSIRAIQVNSNPFSVENDRLGYGRVDVLTKPGAEAYRGSISVEYNDARMNALSRFVDTSVLARPAYHTWLTEGTFGGPLRRNASFHLSAQQRKIDRANLVNTDALDSNYNIVPYVASVDNPRALTNFEPRVDFQLNQKNTLTINYEYFRIAETNDGIDTQTLPSAAFDSSRHHHLIQIMDDQVFSPRMINQLRFQYLHFHNTEVPGNFAPTIAVLGAFTGGGDSGGSLDRHETHYEFQDYATYNRKAHLIRFGGFLRDILRHEDTNAGFNGTFTFNSLSDYQQTLMALAAGQTIAQIQAAGFGPSQFDITGGLLGSSVNRLDGSIFLGDDWKISPQVTASFGLRWESQNAISEHADFAPRFGLAWAVGKGANPRTVIRAGWGVFYQRLDDDQMIMADRMNGTNQLAYVVNQPDFFPNAPDAASLAATAQSFPTVYRIAPNLRSPYDLDTAVSVEQQLTHDATFSLTYLNSRGERQLLTNDVNAPLPGTYNPGDPTSGTRPLGNLAGNIYEYQSAGIFRQQQLIANVHVSAGERLSLFGYYVWNQSRSDTAGVDSFASNPWNLMQDYGRASFDIRNRITVGGTTTLPLAVRLSSMLIANSGPPFSIYLPQDLYGTGIHNARPSLATASTPASNVVQSPYGNFNTAPGALDVPIAPNTATGSANVMLNLRVSRTFGFGEGGNKSHGGEETASGAQGRRHGRGLGGRGLGSGGGFDLGGATTRRYALTFTASALNALNTVNLAPPVHTLGSPLFGQSISLASGPYSAQVGNPVANRLVNVGLSFSF